MARIPMIQGEDADEQTTLLFEAVTAMLGRVPNSYRVLAQSPLVAKMLLPFNAVMQREGAGSLLTTKLKEMVVIKTSHVNACGYWLAHNTSLGQATGITEEQIEAIGSDDYMESPHLSRREKAAVLWAEHVTKNTARGRDDVFAEVSNHFSPPEIVELTLMSGFFNMFNRLMDSLRVPLEIQGEVDKIKRSVQLDPEKIRSYFSTAAEKWPESFPKPEAGPRGTGPE